MKLVKIKHYVEKSYDNKPSFILEMSDGVDYISNSCIFKPISKLDEIIDKFKIPQQQVDELFNSTSIDISDIVNGTSMFLGSNITEFEFDMPNLVYGDFMFYKCSKLKKLTSDMPNLVYNFFIFFGCENLNKKSLENIKKIKL